MINAINNIMSSAPYGYTNFRSNNESLKRLDFQPRLRPQPVIDFFEKSGINGSGNIASKTEKLFPYAEIKKYAPSKRETERNKVIEKEKEHIAKTVTKRTEESKRKLRAAGVNERELYKYITIDGHINSEGQRIIRGN